MRKTLLIIVTLFLAFSCKKENQKIENPKENVEIKQKPVLKFEIECSSSEEDKLQMLFALIELEDRRNGMFMIDDSFKILENNNQILKFSMFEDLIPYVVQLKLGNKPKHVKINRILVSYGEENVFIDGKDVDKYFALNEYVTFDSETATLTTNIKDGKHFPHITLRRGFINKLFGLQ